MAKKLIAAAVLLGAAATAGYFSWNNTRVIESLPSGSQESSPSSLGNARPVERLLTSKADDRFSGASTTFAFEDLKSRAKAGDPVAQRQLAQTYDACFMVNMAPENYLPEYEQRAKYMSSVEDASEMLRVARTRADECRNVDGGAPIPIELIKGWYAQASKNGDVASEATSLSLAANRPDMATSKSLWEGVAHSEDPAAAFSMGELVAGLGLVASGDHPEELMSGLTSGYAWMIAACRNGYDCAPNSRLMQNMCLSTGRCAGETFEEYVRSSAVTAADSQVLDRKIERISAFLKAP
ncbi:hypothetical protein [Stenotrophomonas sp. 278]|uniref:hypothetical protein n=1 Tax=Stenotrophomonas sp. 278 TaxID=2479851 RepID=UPI000F67776D|nr:hypothetical protein [Stenotrophomonas sp. 278]RRU19773.1 hypothetical protein EGJ34_05475 [Stenotrophomonas sp. 278]